MGDSLVYRLGEPVDSLGDPMIVSVDLGSAHSFITYDESSNLIRLHATELQNKHIGLYKITVTAVMTKDLYSKK